MRQAAGPHFIARSRANAGQPRVLTKFDGGAHHRPIPGCRAQMSTSGILKAMIACSFALLASLPRAQGDARSQELSERCKRIAAEQYKNAWGEGHSVGAAMDGRMESHYNVKLRKCFFLETVPGKRVDQSTAKTALFEIQALWDADEKKQYGWLKESDSLGAFESECFVQKTTCHGKEEWRRLIRSFMEE